MVREGQAVSVTRAYSGIIRLNDYGETGDALFLGDMGAPLAEAIMEDMEECGHYLTVRYFIADREATPDELREEWGKTLIGAGSDEVRFEVNYSDITGYLWTDESIMVGGHDLLGELSSAAGQFCLLEVTYDDQGRH